MRTSKFKEEIYYTMKEFTMKRNLNLKALGAIKNVDSGMYGKGNLYEDINEQIYEFLASPSQSLFMIILIRNYL
jgi:hypothetical protein